MATSTPAQPLLGKKVIVTGGARGIGRELALAMASAGADVAVTARSLAAGTETVRAIEALGGRGRAAELDLAAMPSTVASVFEPLVTALGGLDILVCNSGVGGPSGPLWELADDEWDDVFTVNVSGAFRCAKAAAPHLIRAGSGAILFIGSMTGKRPLLHRSPYAASKMALVGLCRTLALDLGPHGVRANVISPGFVDGERLEWVVENQAAARGVGLEAQRSEMVRDTPLRRFTSAADVASTAVFLASDAAAGITGEDVNVSSGLVMY